MATPLGPEAVLEAFAADPPAGVWVMRCSSMVRLRFCQVDSERTISKQGGIRQK